MAGKRQAARRRRPEAKRKKATRGLFAASPEHLRKIALACTEAAACYEVLTKRAKSAEVAGDAMELAIRHRACIDALDAIGLPARRASTCERLRWEWFASTAALLDGAADARLAREGARLSRDAFAAARGLDVPVREELGSCFGAAVSLEDRAALSSPRAALAIA